VTSMVTDWSQRASDDVVTLCRSWAMKATSDGREPQRVGEGLATGLLIMLGAVFGILFVLGAIGAVDALDPVRRDVDLTTYVTAIGSVAAYAVVAVVCWVGAAVLTRMPR
jgi:hypothetical protein